MVGAWPAPTLRNEPSAPAGAPTSLRFGEVRGFWTRAPFVVRSQDGDHPFSMSRHITGGRTLTSSVDDLPGDPELVNAIPPEQYLRRTSSSRIRPTPGRTSSLFVARWAVPSRTWRSTAPARSPGRRCSSSGDLELTRVDLVRGNFEEQGTHDDARHEMKSDARSA